MGANRRSREEAGEGPHQRESEARLGDVALEKGKMGVEWDHRCRGLAALEANTLGPLIAARRRLQLGRVLFQDGVAREAPAGLPGRGQAR